MTRELYENVSEALPSILRDVLEHGEEVGSRQGERTMETLMQTFTLKRPWQREVLVPGRKASIAAQIAETMWVLAGRNDVEWLSHYLPRAAEFSDDGRTWRGAYGPRIRAWTAMSDHGRPWSHDQQVDQLAHVVNLLNSERGTRRAVMSIYDPIVDMEPGKDIPCNNWLSFISRLGKLHMNVATRSNDVIWGWSGINQFEWSVLQEIVAYLTGNQVGTLTFNVTSLHVYEKHWDKARDIVNRSDDVTIWPADSPRFAPEERTVDHLDKLIAEWFLLEENIRTGVQVGGRVDRFPEPMMQSWLRVLQWYWGSGNLEHLEGTRLAAAARMSPTPPALKIHHVFPTTAERVERDKGLLAFSTRGVHMPLAWTTQFVEYVDNLHREKSAVYGDSWKKRGEQISTLANIARKIDRLGVDGAGDSAADTVIDLLVYLAKYRLWLNEQIGSGEIPAESEEDAVREILNVEDQTCPKVIQRKSLDLRLVGLQEAFRNLESVVTFDPHLTGGPVSRISVVDNMIRLAFPAARLLWGEENGHLLKPNQAAEMFKVPLPEVTNATRRWAGYEVGENID